MKCPVDNATLLITDRSGIEIDYCPDCRGVWLDRGELDKLIEGSVHSAPRYDDDDRRPRESHEGGQRKKKESFLGDIFDF